MDLEQRVMAWLKAEGLDIGGAPLARATSLLAFVHTERVQARLEMRQAAADECLMSRRGNACDNARVDCYDRIQRLPLED